MSDEPILVPEQRGARRKDGVVRFVRRDRAATKSGPAAPTDAKSQQPGNIGQADLEMYFLLRRELYEARQRFEQHKDYLRARLPAGVDFELRPDYGVHVLSVQPNPRGKRPKLIVR